MSGTGHPLRLLLPLALAVAVLTAAPAPSRAVEDAPVDGSGHYREPPSTVVRDWQSTALRTVHDQARTPRWLDRALLLGLVATTVDAAVRDALRHPAPSSPVAAAAQAAHDVLATRFPAAAPRLDADLTHSLAAVLDGPDKDRGVILGAIAADRTRAGSTGPAGSVITGAEVGARWRVSRSLLTGTGR